MLDVQDGDGDGVFGIRSVQSMANETTMAIHAGQGQVIQRGCYWLHLKPCRAELSLGLQDPHGPANGTSRVKAELF